MNKSSVNKSQIIKDFGKSAKNTGSTEAQIAILTAEINYITEHAKLNKKDYSAKRGLYIKVSLRKKLLKYLKAQNIAKYREICEKIDIRAN